MARFRLPSTLAGTLEAQYPELAERIATEVQEQAAYLSRFADEIAVRQLLDRPLSEAAVLARSVLYGGAGRAAYFRTKEVLSGEGYVCDYEARDDKGTCAECLGAEAGSPYLAGLGPYPGSVCRGRGRCRCRRRSRYAPKEAERLRQEQGGD